MPQQKPVSQKLIENDHGNKLYQRINSTYKYYTIIWGFTKKLLFFTSTRMFLRFLILMFNLVTILFLLPVGFEISHDQLTMLKKLQQKIDTIEQAEESIDFRPF